MARYQTLSFTFTAVQPKDVPGQFIDNWTHTFDVTMNPCDGSFTGTGSVSGTPSAGDSHGFLSNETITGQRNGDTISFTATRVSDGLVTTLNNAPLDGTTVTGLASFPNGSPNPIEVKVKPATNPVWSDFKNHGDYVSQSPDKNDAAHSCIGMPRPRR